MVGQAVPTYLYVFSAALLVSLFTTPFVRRAAAGMGFLDLPGERRVHRLPVPKGGGIGIYVAFWAGIAWALPWQRELFGFWLASTVLLGVGLIDDRFELRWYSKLAGQLGAAVLLVAFGQRIEFVTNPFSGATLYIGWWGIPLTVAWLVALANMVNLIDGLDGLAAGVCAIAAVPLFWVALAKGRPEAALMTLALAGAALGFLPYNFNPAKIIMGDAGSMFLGFALGTISVEGALKGPTALALIVPVLAFGLPILDTVFSVVRRLASGKPVYAPDRDHLHHRLLAMGLSQRQAVVTLYGISGLMGAGAIAALDGGAVKSLGVFLLVAAGSVLFAHRIGGLRGAHLRSPVGKDTPGL